MKNNSDDIVIKPITVDDALLLSDVALRAYKDHYLHLWHEGGEWYMEKSFAVHNLAAELASSNSRFFMVYVAGQPAGFIKINIDAPLEDETNALELERIYFVKAVNGRGVGTKAMEHIMAIAKGLGKKILWLKVMDSSTAAIAFYKKFGFDICGTYRLDFVQMKEELRGMYVMKAAL